MFKVEMLAHRSNKVVSATTTDYHGYPLSTVWVAKRFKETLERHYGGRYKITRA